MTTTIHPHNLIIVASGPYTPPPPPPNQLPPRIIPIKATPQEQAHVNQPPPRPTQR